MANHSPFASVPRSDPFCGSIKEEPSGAITNDVHWGVNVRTDVMTQRDPQASADSYIFSYTSISSKLVLYTLISI